MNLEILSQQEALQFHPKDRTYAIRIFSEFVGGYVGVDHLKQLQSSDLCFIERQYVFDDVWPNMPGGIRHRETPINPAIAGKIISEFSPYCSSTDTLLVHCLRGENRSPAVALALNDMFHLGNDSQVIREAFPNLRPFVYDMMMNTYRSLKKSAE